MLAALLRLGGAHSDRLGSPAVNVVCGKRSVAGDPEATGPAMLAVVDAEEPPLRVFFGDSGLPMTRKEYADRVALWEKWDDVAIMAQGEARNRAACRRPARLSDRSTVRGA